MSSNFCVYLTSYQGSKLPPFYIGSSSPGRIDLGYKGSVKSKKYASVWKKELHDNPHLFKTRALSTIYKTREEATEAERRLHVKLKVVKSDLYVNQAVATKNGFFGRDVSGKNHPLFGIKRSEETRAKIKMNHAHLKGVNSASSALFKFTSPAGEEFEVLGGFKQFCEAHNLSYSSMLFTINGREFLSGSCVGWKCERLHGRTLKI